MTVTQARCMLRIRTGTGANVEPSSAAQMIFCASCSPSQVRQGISRSGLLAQQDPRIWRKVKLSRPASRTPSLEGAFRREVQPWLFGIPAVWRWRYGWMDAGRWAEPQVGIFRRKHRTVTNGRRSVGLAPIDLDGDEHRRKNFLFIGLKPVSNQFAQAMLHPSALLQNC